MLLLGMLMVMMAYSQVKVEEAVKQNAEQSPLQQFVDEGVTVVPMVAIAEGANKGKAAVLNEELKRVGYIDPAVPEEFEALLARRGINRDEQVVIALLFIDEGFDARFGTEYLREQWNVIIAKTRRPKSLKPQS